MKRVVGRLICDKCGKEVIPLWKDITEQEQEYIHRQNLSAFCDYSPETLKVPFILLLAVLINVVVIYFLLPVEEPIRMHESIILGIVFAMLEIGCIAIIGKWLTDNWYTAELKAIRDLKGKK